MSWILLRDALEIEGLPHLLKDIYTLLCYKAINGRTAVSMRWLMRKAGISLGSVRNALHGLEIRKLIRLDRRGNGRGITSYYYILPVKKGTPLIPFLPSFGYEKGARRVQKRVQGVAHNTRQEIKIARPPSAAATPRTIRLTDDTYHPRSLFLEQLRAKDHANAR